MDTNTNISNVIQVHLNIKSMLHGHIGFICSQFNLLHGSIGQVLLLVYLLLLTDGLCRHLLRRWYCLLLHVWGYFGALWSVLGNAVVQQDSSQDTNSKCGGASHHYCNPHSTTCTAGGLCDVWKETNDIISLSGEKDKSLLYTLWALSSMAQHNNIIDFMIKLWSIYPSL